MSTFFDDTPLTGTELPSTEELRARSTGPEGYEGHMIVRVGEHFVWRLPEDIKPGDEISFYDGDCRNVLLPDDPRLKG